MNNKTCKICYITQPKSKFYNEKSFCKDCYEIKVICSCGKLMNRAHMIKHKTTKYHISNIGKCILYDLSGTDLLVKIMNETIDRKSLTSYLLNKYKYINIVGNRE